MNDEQEEFEIMLEYLQLKIRKRDWHAVADCAMDLREMELEKKINGRDQRTQVT